MSNTLNKEAPQIVKSNIQILNLQDSCTLEISEHLQNQIDYLHSRTEIKGLEWSGILLWSIKEGDITDPANLVIVAHGLYLMDIGNASYTEYEYEPDDFDKLFKEYPLADPFENDENTRWMMGHVHTHHSMDTFFSGTDLKELEENAPKHKYYLSLIVNYANKFAAKLCVTGKEEATVRKITSVFGNKEVIEPEKTIIYQIPADIYLPNRIVVNNFFTDRYSELKPVPKAPVGYNYNSYASTGGGSSITFPKGSQKETQAPKKMEIEYSIYNAQDVRWFLVNLLTFGTPGTNRYLYDILLYTVGKVKPENFEDYLQLVFTDFFLITEKIFPHMDFDSEYTLGKTNLVTLLTNCNKEFAIHNTNHANAVLKRVCSKFIATIENMITELKEDQPKREVNV
jgi:hypothetical protein